MNLSTTKTSQSGPKIALTEPNNGSKVDPSEFKVLDEHNETDRWEKSLRSGTILSKVVGMYLCHTQTLPYSSRHIHLVYDITHLQKHVE